MQDSQGNQNFSRVSIRTVLFSTYKGSPELMTAFLGRAKRAAYCRDRVLFWRGEAAKDIYVVVDGQVELFLGISDDSPIGFRAYSGSFIGLPAAYTAEPYSMTAVASIDSQVAVMRREEFCLMVAASAALSIDVLKILAAEIRAARLALRLMG